MVNQRQCVVNRRRTGTGANSLDRVRVYVCGYARTSAKMMIDPGCRYTHTHIPKQIPVYQRDCTGSNAAAVAAATVRKNRS